MRLIYVGIAALSLALAPAQKAGVATINSPDQVFTRLAPADRVVVSTLGSAKSDDGLVFIDRRLESLELSGEKASELSRLWRGLRAGNGAGCFSPGYALEFYAGKTLSLSAKVCFHCCNIALPDRSIHGMCGDEKAMKRFQALLDRTLPYPKTAREK